MSNSRKPIFCMGDSHAIQPCIRLCRDIPAGAVVIHVGDFGVWDIPRVWKDLEDLARVCDKRSIEFLAIRGNHESADPSIWCDRKIGPITLLSDYAERVINGQKFLFIGGAYSVDRSARVKFNWPYDPNEPMIYKPTTPCDILLTHTGPRRYLDHLLTFPIERYFAIDANLKDDLQREQDMIDDILRDCKPKVHVWGHFHVSNKCRDNGTVFQCLDIEEVKTLEEIRS